MTCLSGKWTISDMSDRQVDRVSDMSDRRVDHVSDFSDVQLDSVNDLQHLDFFVPYKGCGNQIFMQISHINFCRLPYNEYNIYIYIYI